MVVPASVFEGWPGRRRSRGPPLRESPSPAPDEGAEAGKPGEPHGGREEILLSLPPSPPVAAHTGWAPGRGGCEDGTSRATRGGDKETTLWLMVDENSRINDLSCASCATVGGRGMEGSNIGSRVV